MTNSIWIARHWPKVALAAALAAGLAACDGGGGGGGGGVIITPPPPAAPALEDQFGVAFGAAFRVASNGEPRDPAPGDIIPICITCDPINIP